VNDSDKKEFSEAMTAAGEIYNKVISNGLLKLYFSSLKALSIDDVLKGIECHLTDSDQGTFFPKPADIVRNATSGAITVKDKAELGWAQIIGEISRVGSYGSLDIDDRQAMATVRALGGWKELCTLTYEQLDWKKKEFFNIYETYESTPIDALPSKLPGLIELQNHKIEEAEKSEGGMKLIADALRKQINKMEGGDNVAIGHDNEERSGQKPLESS
jgi:hypothetical protein